MSNSTDGYGREVLPGDFYGHKIAVSVKNKTVQYCYSNPISPLINVNSMPVSDWLTTHRGGKPINEVSPLVKDRSLKVIEAGKKVVHESMSGIHEVLCITRVSNGKIVASLRKANGIIVSAYAHRLTIYEPPKEKRVHLSIVVPETTDINKFLDSIKGARIENVIAEYV